MHELSIAQSIISTVLAEMKNRDFISIKKIGVGIGVLSGVFPDALQFGYETLAKNTALENTEMVIEKIPVCGKCEECQHEYQVDDFVFICPNCSSKKIEMISGNELDIKYLEVENSNFTS